QKQPDNKEYTLELTGVLNRIAELELFTAGDGTDATKLASARVLLKDCSDMLTTLLEDARDDAAAVARTRARLGECYALLARLDLAAAKPDAAAVDRAWATSGTANDAFTKLNEQRNNLSPSEQYQQAAARFLRLELYLKKGGATDKSSASYFEAPQ